MTVNATEVADMGFQEAHLISIKGIKHLVVLDTLGKINYFNTRALRMFNFVGRFPTGYKASDINSLVM